MGKQKELKVTPLDIIREKAKGIIVELPGWDDESFIARLKRPSLEGLIKSGSIPNELLDTVWTIWEGKATKTPNLDKDMFFKAMNAVLAEVFAEPSFEDIKDYLTDEQKIAAFNWTQGGMKALLPFRSRQESNDKGSGSMQGVEEVAKRLLSKSK